MGHDVPDKYFFGETVAASHVIRREALPLQILFSHLLGRSLGIELNVDNTQAISAIEKGYSKKLRHLARTQRVCIGLLNELLHDPEIYLSIVHCPTDSMKADLFSKMLQRAKFTVALDMIGMRVIEQDHKRNDAH